MTMREFVTAADEQVCTIFKASGSLALMYHAIDDEGKDNVFLAPAVEDKDMALVLVRCYLAHIKATRVMSMMEAWVIDASHDEEKARRAMAYAETGESLEHAPGRAEAIVYVVEDAAEGALMAQRLITRDAGRKAKLGPLTFLPQEGTQEGRMVGLLPRGTLQ